jgi:hypothetical protein
MLGKCYYFSIIAYPQFFQFIFSKDLYNFWFFFKLMLSQPIFTFAMVVKVIFKWFLTSIYDLKYSNTKFIFKYKKIERLL